jgi:ParB family chromosome partitioning protein
MVSGHRRMHAAQVLGLKRIPAFIREMTDDEATVRMVDSNIQREELLPSEKAFAYKMKMDAMRRQGVRTDLTSAQNDQKLTSSTSRTLLAEQFGISGAQISRYIRLTELIPGLLNLVDKKRLPFTVAVEISYIDPEVQGWLYEYIRENGQVKLNQISALRDQMKTGVISQSKMIEILNNSQPGRLPSLKLTFTENNLREFFPEGYSVSQMRSVIEDLLSEWKMNREEGGLYEV